MEKIKDKGKIFGIAFVLLTVICGMITAGNVFAETGSVTVSSYDELNQAVAEAKDGQEQTIEVSGTIAVPDTIQIDANKKIRITAKDGSGVLEGSEGKYLFHVQEGAALTLDQNITLSKGLYVNCNGDLVVKQATLTGGKLPSGSNYEGKGAVNIEGAKASFTMAGGTIKNTVVAASSSGVIRISSGAKGTFNGGMLCNNQINNQMCGTLLIHNGGACEMKNGKIKDNKASGQIQSSGGVLVLALDHNASTKKAGQEASFIMDGGEISGNESPFGGGVYVYGGNAAYYGDLFSKAYFTMNDGTIKGNKATGYGNSDFTGGGGGGVYVECGGEFTMNGGSIIENSSYGEGGGVATYDQFVSVAGGKKKYTAYKGVSYLGREDLSKWPEFFPAAFVMNGGKVSDNHAISRVEQGDNGCGGGVYCASSGVNLNAGKIENNEADKQGGGVYVGSVPYVLHMYNCLITENEASVIGGGAWFCPTGELSSFINSGSAVYDNTAKAAGDDLAVVRNNHSYKTTVADRILGGGKALWHQDGAIDCNSVLGSADTTVARYQAGSDKNVSVSNIKNSQEALALKAVPTDYAKQQAKASAKLTIKGNSSMRGGGLGSNGGMILGKSYEAPQEISVEKIWKTEDNDKNVEIPESVVIWLVTENGQRVDRAVLNVENNWKHTFKGLPSNIEYKVEEDSVKGWTVSYQESETPDGDKSFEVINTYTPDVPEQPTNPDQPSKTTPAAETGDSATPLLWILLCGLAAAGVVTLLVRRESR